jgi:hypothetical protein
MVPALGVAPGVVFSAPDLGVSVCDAVTQSVG